MLHFYTQINLKKKIICKSSDGLLWLLKGATMTNKNKKKKRKLNNKSNDALMITVLIPV